MADRKEVEAEFKLNIKGLCVNLAVELLDPGFVPSKVMDEFTRDIKRAFGKRDAALAELKTVKIERRHLLTMQDLMLTLIKRLGFDETHRLLNRYPTCFGEWKLAYGRDCDMGDDLCAACIAVTKALGKDC